MTATILMCPPDYFGIEYEINPWMHRSIPSDRPRAITQWTALTETLRAVGADLRFLTPQPGLPDLVFTANAGLMWHDTVFLARFRYAARQGETPINRAWFEQAGYLPVELPDGMNFEGAGDALFLGDTLYAGYLIRSDAQAMHWLADAMGCRAIPLQLVDTRFYHLDTCFCPLDPETALYYPPAFDDYARQALLQSVPRLIAVNEAEATRFACNAVVVGRHVVMNTGCPELAENLRRSGFEPHETPLDEFLKSGGSAKCLTLRLDGEEAALWPPSRDQSSRD